MVTAKHNGTTMEIRTIEDLVDALNDVTVDDPRLVLKVDDEEFVLRVVSRRKRRTKGERVKDDEEAILSFFGSWKGLIDPEELKKQISEGRGHNCPLAGIEPPNG